MGTCGIVFFVARKGIISLYNEDPAVIKVGGTILFYAAFWQIFDALYVASAGSLRGAGDTLYTMVIYFGLGWLVFLPCAYVTCRVLKLGVNGAWAAAACFIAIAGVLAFIRWQRGGWQRLQIYQKNVPVADEVVSGETA